MVDETFFFSHIPKCGGTWVSNILRTVPHVITSDALLAYDDMQEHTHFGFIRNPWSWYVSWYNFCRYGSEIVPDHKGLSDLLALRGDNSFESVVKHYCKPTPKFKKSLWNSTHHLSVSEQQASHFRVTGLWLDSDNSYLEHLYDLYLKDVAFVGKNENLRNDLVEVLTKFNLITDNLREEIENSPRIQVGKKVDYRTYYTDETAQLVADTHQRIIEKHNYTFDK